MKTQALFVSILVVAAASLILTVAVQGMHLPGSPAPLVTPKPPVPVSPPHVLYDPFRHWNTLPTYPSTPRTPRPQPWIALTKPAGVDLDVAYISRTPMYNRYDVWYTADGKPYLRPGTENDKRWPVSGEVVTFTAHIINKGTVASGSFAFKWFIDGSEVHSGIHSSLAPGEEGTETYQWVWAHTMDGERLLGSHTVRFTVDPANAIPETYESNNSLEDRTDALSLVLAMTPELYTALETPVDPQWPFSAEDWLQKQIAAMNAAFIRSVYPSAPNGIVERVRLNKILVTSTAPPADMSEDGGFFMTADDRFGNAYYDPTTDVSGGLLHELTHQLGIIDLYNIGFPLEVPQVIDHNGRPVQMETGLSMPGLMTNPGIQPPVYDEHTALALNANKGYRRGYYGEYLYDVPAQTYLRVLDNQGNPAPGVIINLYQRASSPNMLGSRHGVIDNIPEISVETNSAGVALLPNRPVGEPVTTHTGHTLTDNPLGVINVVGTNDEFLVEIRKGTHQEFGWLDITQFNLATWRGETTLEILSHVPPDGAPAPPAELSGILEYGQVELEWLPSPSPGISGYNVYRTSGLASTWTRLVTKTTALSYTAPYDYGARAVGYAVTAVDNSGGESGFSDLFWALRLLNPASVVVDENNRRIILDPQNGYALLLQSADGLYLDTLGSYDLHLENSQYMARDPEGRLVISHPGDWYSSRHSVRVTDQDANLLFEFGERGSGPGQLETPAGVAVWGQPCTIEGPYAVDGHTLLLLHFDGSYHGAQYEPGAPSGTTFAAGKYAQGVAIDSNDTLTYATAGNLNLTQGAIEFWIRPNWDGGDGQGYTFFEVGTGWFNRMRIMKDGANNLRFMVWDSTTEYGVAYNIAHWQAGEWHHIAATWEGTSIALFVDGQQRDSSNTARLPDTLADTIYIGSSLWHDQQANAVIDELRISDIPRIGNSDTCSYRILVADSGNHRIQVFNAEGDFVSAYGGYGNGPGEFNNPQGLAVDSSGNVIVADTGNNRLQVLSFDGANFGLIRKITAGFNGPIGVTTYGSDRIIVADRGNNRIKVLDGEGSLLAEYAAPNDGHTGTFNQPRGVIVDRNGNIVVADTGNRRLVAILGALPKWELYLPLVLRTH
ncbi:MAG: LamG-like jellyroll fold domain-containing protein, partial [Anaerolineae bacterium]